jgi:hypothetical protein
MSHQSHAERAAAVPKCAWCGEALDTEPDKRRQYHRLCFVEFTQVQQGREIEALARIAGKLAVALERFARRGYLSVEQGEFGLLASEAEGMQRLKENDEQ